MAKSAESFIIDDQEAGLFRVNRRVFTDPECLAEERRRVFDKCWFYVGHQSEVPHEGDYRSRNVMGRPMILVRGDDSVVRVLLNTCTHRGSLVCRQKSGNARTFQCPYQAWTFNSRGQLVGVPGEDSYSRTATRSSATTWRWPRRLKWITTVDSFSPASTPRRTASMTTWRARASTLTWLPISLSLE